MIRRLIALAACLPIVAAAQGTPAAAPAPKPVIYFRTPANGATVTSPFTVEFGLRNYGVAPAGVNATSTGHFHVLVDSPVPAVGEVIPKDAKNLHFGGGQIETKLSLPPGKHTLVLVLGDMDHKVIGPDLVSKPITVTVK